MLSANPQIDSARLDLPVADTTMMSENDTIITAELQRGLVFTTTEKPKSPPVEVGVNIGLGESLITGFMILLFCLLGIRFGNNVKYLAALRRDLLDIRERGNVFDDTVRETSFLLLMNMLWIVSAGVLLSYAVGGYANGWILSSDYEPGWKNELVCIGIAAVYELLMWGAYWVTGSVFSDSTRTRMWTKAFSAGQGLTGVAWFFIALLLDCYPHETLPLLITAGVVFIIIRIMFIFKGAMIFFNKISSWMVFLCYLCNLEIVPLILTFAAATWLVCAT